MDKRSVETRGKIEHSLAKLWISGNTPSVKEVAALCGINRNTFYLHYANVEEATQCMLERFTARIIERIESVPIEELFLEPQILSQSIADVLCENEQTRRLTLQSPIAHGYLHTLTRELVDYVYSRYEEKEKDRKDVYLSIDFLVAGFTHALYTLVNLHPDVEDVHTLLKQMEELAKKGVIRKLIEEGQQEDC